MQLRSTQDKGFSSPLFSSTTLNFKLKLPKNAHVPSTWPKCLPINKENMKIGKWRDEAHKQKKKTHAKVFQFLSQLLSSYVFSTENSVCTKPLKYSSMSRESQLKGVATPTSLLFPPLSSILLCPISILLIGDMVPANSNSRNPSDP